MNSNKFDSCLQAYLEHCLSTTWIKDESYKFFFANWLYRSVNIKLQSSEKILLICKQSLKNDYSVGKESSRFGVQFLQKSGREKLSIPISLSDVEIVKYLSDSEIPDESFFKKRGTSYPGLSGWLGTLIPTKFMPVVTSDFHETISYLFDLDSFPESGYPFFVETQKYFIETKQYLKRQNLDQLYLNNILRYLEQEYPKVQKTRYEEIDWNWITQDFHLFIFRKYLHDMQFKKASSKNKYQSNENDETSKSTEEPVTELQLHFQLELYDPQVFTHDIDDLPTGNRNLKFDKDHYLNKYQKQLEKGSWAEELVKADEINHLVRCGKASLAGNVQIVSENPDYGFDILSFELDGTQKQIEVKSISKDDPKTFYISANELRKSGELPNYYIHCVSSINNDVQKIYRLKSPNLKDQNIFKMTATNYEVCFL